MEISSTHNLQNALAQLKVSVHELDLVRNDIVKHTEELDGIKENLENAIVPAVQDTVPGGNPRRRQSAGNRKTAGHRQP